jgi:hypothetical protein
VLHTVPLALLLSIRLVCKCWLVTTLRLITYICKLRKKKFYNIGSSRLVDQMPVGQMKGSESVDKMSVGEMFFGEKRWRHLRSPEESENSLFKFGSK